MSHIRAHGYRPPEVGEAALETAIEVAAGKREPGPSPTGRGGPQWRAMSQEQPVDPDVDLHVPGQRAELPRAPWTTLGAISAGGACGALARYGVAEAFGHPPGAFAWATLIVNAAGCLLIGVLMVTITEVRAAHRLVRPFLGVGVLGGFTTFSTYAVDAQRAIEDGAAGTALLYLAATPVCALAAVLAGVRLTRALARPGRAEEP